MLTNNLKIEIFWLKLLYLLEYPELQEEEDEDLKNVEQNHQRVCSFLHEIIAEISRTFPE